MSETTVNHLALLPPELLLEICSFLDNRTLLLLARAWKWFLKYLGAPFDPRHPARQRLREHVADKDQMDQILFARFQDTAEGSQNQYHVSPHAFRFAEPAFCQAFSEFAQVWDGSAVRGFPLHFIAMDCEWIPNRWMKQWSKLPRSLRNAFRVHVEIPRSDLGNNIWLFRFFALLHWIKTAPCIDGITICLEDAHVKLFVHHLKTFVGVERLLFRRCYEQDELTPEIINAIATNVHFRVVELASLEFPLELSADMLCSLLRSPSIRILKLKNLELVGGSVDADPWATVSEALATNPQLQTLHLELRNSEFLNQQLLAIVRGCAKSTVIRQLRFFGMPLRDESVMSGICACIQNHPSLQYLYLCYGDLDNEDGFAERIMSAVHANQSLRFLSLAGNHLGKFGVLHLAHGFLVGKFGSVQQLHLNCNDVTVHLEQSYGDLAKKCGFTWRKVEAFVKEEETFEATSVDAASGVKRKLRLGFV